MDAITTVLRRCEIFSGLSDADLSLIARAATRREVPAGTCLFTQGEVRTGATVVAEGRVEVTRDNGDGPEPVVILGPGDVAGEQAFLGVSNHSATGTTLSATVLLQLDREAVLGSLAQDGNAAISVLSKVASVLHQRLLYSATPRTGREQAFASLRTRRETDLLGTLEVPEDALFGVQTLRAVHNFPITGTPTSHFPAMIRAWPWSSRRRRGPMPAWACWSRSSPRPSTRPPRRSSTATGTATSPQTCLLYTSDAADE